MIIVPQQDASVGDLIDFEGKTFRVDEHYSQGKDMIGKNYTHIMYSNKGAFGMVEA